jgi:hypothetical protein
VVKFEAATDVYSVSVADVPLDEVRAASIVVLAALDVVDAVDAVCTRVQSVSVTVWAVNVKGKQSAHVTSEKTVVQSPLGEWLQVSAQPRRSSPLRATVVFAS